MNSTDSVVIPLSKGKLWLAAVGCVIFIILGFFFVLRPWYLRSPFIHSLWIIRGIGFISLIVFGYFLGAHIPKLRDRSPGLVIDASGILDNSTSVGNFHIGWDEILDVRQTKISFNKYMVVVIKNPEAFIEKVEDKGKQRLLNANYKICGSPITIPSSTLKCKFKDLKGNLKEAFERYKNNS